MKIFGIMGWSGSGKTTLLVELLPVLIRRGISVSTIKRTHHNVDLDQPGKDSYRHRMAGASEVMLASAKRWVLMHELRDEPQPTIEDIAAIMTPVDLLLVEGFKTERHPKLEVHRPSIGKELLAPRDSSVVAVASDEKLLGLRVPVFALDDVSGIGVFIVEYCGLAKRKVADGAA